MCVSLLRLCFSLHARLFYCWRWGGGYLSFRDWGDMKEEWNCTCPEKRKCWVIDKRPTRGLRIWRGLKEKWRIWALNICFLLLWKKNEECSYNAFSEAVWGHWNPWLWAEKTCLNLPEPFLWLLRGIAARKGCRAVWGWPPAPRLRPDIAACLALNFFIEFHWHSLASRYQDCHWGNLLSLHLAVISGLLIQLLIRILGWL